MAAEAAWKAVVRKRVGEAASRCARADAPICDVLGHLGAPEHAADDAAAWRAWAQRAEAKLADASRDLAAAASLMAAAGTIALHGAAPSPAAPLRSAADVPGDDDLRIGLEKLHQARDRAEEACRVAEECRVELCAVTLMLGHSLLPGNVLDNLRVSTRRDLDGAQKMEQESISLACNTLARLL